MNQQQQIDQAFERSTRRCAARAKDGTLFEVEYWIEIDW